MEITFPCNSIMTFGLKILLSLSVFGLSLVSCAQDIALLPNVERGYDWQLTDSVIVRNIVSFDIQHQCAACYGDYVFLVSKGRSEVYLYNLKRKELLYVLKLEGEDDNTYHCNQCSFGIDRYNSDDPFPLLYISQRTKFDNRCFVEVFRIIPGWNPTLSIYDSFSIELIQTIYFPTMTEVNSLGNVNCVFDISNSLIYSYSRNNDSYSNNYGRCKISSFLIPDLHEVDVYLDDVDIKSSFILDCNAFIMQGGCINDNYLYIGQGYYNAGYIYLNIIDLKNQVLIKRFDLLKQNIRWEPEGCFFYNERVMLTHTSGISAIETLIKEDN